MSKLAAIAAALVVTACSHARVGHASRMPPMDATEAYVRADIDLLLSRSDDAAMLALDARHEAEQLIRQEAIATSQALNLLASGQAWLRETAQAAIIARGSVTEEEALVIAGRYAESDEFLVRYHGMQVLAMCNADVAARHSDLFAGALLRERNDAIRGVAVTLATKLSGHDRERVMLEYVRTGSPQLARSAYAVAWSAGRVVACELRSKVVQLGRGSGLEVLQQIEALEGVTGCGTGER